MPSISDHYNIIFMNLILLLLFLLILTYGDLCLVFYYVSVVISYWTDLNLQEP